MVNVITQLEYRQDKPESGTDTVHSERQAGEAIEVWNDNVWEGHKGDIEGDTSDTGSIGLHDWWEQAEDASKQGEGEADSTFEAIIKRMKYGSSSIR